VSRTSEGYSPVPYKSVQGLYELRLRLRTTNYELGTLQRSSTYV